MAEKFSAKGLVEYVKSKIGQNYFYSAKGLVLTQSTYEWALKAYPDMCYDWEKSKIGTWCTDCSGLISSYCTGYVLNSTALYTQAKTKYDISKIKDAPIGTILYTSGHVGVYIGYENNKPMCVEAKDSKSGVVKSEITSKKFTTILLMDYINYEEEKKMEQITDVNKALDKLVSDGIISTKDYWINAITVMKYLDILLINASNLTQKREEYAQTINDFEHALKACIDNKIISNGAYWSKAATTNKYVYHLIMNIANHI